ncbi:hypothetical protein C1H46_003206 [Malus baccata]|uniref:Uncharacterized protein n=1 Tax=Malus baccata TaxID=106549 RepID=A0A540NL14_MALBA|nr:hypothetical protein C1H46_003206 [Malus baccata]
MLNSTEEMMSLVRGTGRNRTGRGVPFHVWYAKNGWNALFYGTEIGCFCVPPLPWNGLFHVCGTQKFHCLPSFSLPQLPSPVASLPSLSPVASSSTKNPATQMLRYPNVASLPSNPDEFELDFGLSGLSRRRIRRNRPKRTSF